MVFHLAISTSKDLQHCQSISEIPTPSQHDRPNYKHKVNYVYNYSQDLQFPSHVFMSSICHPWGLSIFGGVRTVMGKIWHVQGQAKLVSVYLKYDLIIKECLTKLTAGIEFWMWLLAACNSIYLSRLQCGLVSESVFGYSRIVSLTNAWNLVVGPLLLRRTTTATPQETRNIGGHSWNYHWHPCCWWFFHINWVSKSLNPKTIVKYRSYSNPFIIASCTNQTSLLPHERC